MRGDEEIPTELKRLLPGMLQELASGRRMIFPAVVAFGIISYVSSGSPLGLWNLLAPTAGVVLAALYLTVRPWNPFKSLYADLEGMSPETVRDDAAAQQLLTMLSSREARLLPWMKAPAVVASFALLVVAWSLTLPLKSTALDPETATALALIWALFSLGLFIHIQLRWVISSWAPIEAAPE